MYLDMLYSQAKMTILFKHARGKLSKYNVFLL